MLKKFAVFLVASLLSAQAMANSLGVFATQQDTYLVFSISETVELIPGEPTTIDGTDFLTNQIGIDVQVEAEEAKMFLNNRFGIDIDQLVAEGRGLFTVFEIKPEIQNRVRIFNNAFVPAEGLPLRSAGFGFISIDPAGIELGADFEETVLQPGGLLAQGYWFFKPLKQEKVILKWAMETPLMRPLSQLPLFFTDVSTMDGSQIGTGAGIDSVRTNDNGTITPLFRHVVELKRVE